MYYLLRTLFDTIFPPSDEALCVRALTPEQLTSLFSHTVIDGTHVLSAYRDTRIRALIHEAKFHGNTDAFLLLSTLCTKYLESAVTTVDVIIPVPLSPARLRARGYNQVHEIFRAAATQAHIPIETGVLKRIRNTRPQTELKRTERHTNMRDAFGVAHGERISGKHILLVDDVMTTGTTLRAAKATLLPHGASITCLAIAH